MCIYIYIYNVYIYIYALNLFIEHSGEHWWEQNIFCWFTIPQAFWQSSAPGLLFSTVNPSYIDGSWEGRNTRLWIYTLQTHSLSTLENTDENRIFPARSSHHHTTSTLAKLSTRCFEHSGNISCSPLVNPSHTNEAQEGRNTRLWMYKYKYICIYICTHTHIYIYIYIYTYLYIYIYVYIYIYICAFIIPWLKLIKAIVVIFLQIYIYWFL